MIRYLTAKQVREIYGYNVRVLARWADAGKVQYIKSPGGKRSYLESSFRDVSSENKETILYSRISTANQKKELLSQQTYLAGYYPKAKVITDIGSGLNFRRKNFIKLMQDVADKKVDKIVVGHKDRLCRFGFEFVEWFCNLNGCKIEVLNNAKLSPHAELMKDFMDIMHCFSSKLYFLRRYKDEISKEKVE